MTTEKTLTVVQEFITRWKESGAAERANYRFAASLSQTSPNNAGSVALTARIR